MLCDQQVDRYSRQIILPEVGAQGQERLLSASVAVVDAGGQWSFLLLYLAAAGVGHVVVHDPRHRSATERQAREAADLNPDCRIEVRFSDPCLESGQFAVAALVEAAAARSTGLALACARSGTPLIWSRSRGSVGYLGTARPAGAAGCYGCAARTLDLGHPGQWPPAAPLVASVQAVEAIRLVLAIGSDAGGGIVRIDAAAGDFAAIEPPRSTRCVVCEARQAQ